MGQYVRVDVQILQSDLNEFQESIYELKKAFEKAKNDKHWAMYKYNAIGIEEEL